MLESACLLRDEREPILDVHLALVELDAIRGRQERKERAPTFSKLVR